MLRGMLKGIGQLGGVQKETMLDVKKKNKNKFFEAISKFGKKHSKEY
jgi:hypothetical protein